jgi:hypothetical protein
MVTVPKPQRREVNSVLPADPEASSHAETQPTSQFRLLFEAVLKLRVRLNAVHQTYG